MRLYLSAILTNFPKFNNSLEGLIDSKTLYSLVTFGWHYKRQYSHIFKDFIVDSGAYSFMGGSSNTPPVEEIYAYTQKYAMRMKEDDIDHFVEMDIERVYGFQVYRDCLHMLQDITGREPLRVWHPHRGWDYIDALSRKFDWVCLGGINFGTVTPDIMDRMLRIAHSNGCRVHALGVADLEVIKTYPFDSTDTSSWVQPILRQRAAYFTGRQCELFEKRVDDKSLFRHNLLEYAKLAAYLEHVESVWI